eukprot:9503861-Pyramimonas_sp.AAC.3
MSVLPYWDMRGAHLWRWLVCSLWITTGISPAEGKLPHHVDAADWALRHARILASMGVNDDIYAGCGPTLLQHAIGILLSDIGRIKRDTAFVELFSGAGIIASAVAGQKLKAFTFDREDGSLHENVCSAVFGGYDNDSAPHISPGPHQFG